MGRKTDIARYKRIVALIESALNVVESDMSATSKLQILTAMGLDPNTYANLSVRSNTFVRLSQDELISLLKEELHSFQTAIKHLQQWKSFHYL